MKRISCFLICAFCIVLVRAQGLENKNEIGVSTGVSLISGVLNRVLKDDALKYGFNSSPVYSITYDRKVNSWLQLGANFSQQAMTVTFEEYADNDGILQTGEFEAHMKRRQIHLRAIGYYEKNHFRFRSGLRVGLANWNADVNTENRDLKFIDQLAGLTLPSLGLMVIGVDYSPMHWMSIGTEINLFSPQVLAGSLQIHF